MLVSTFAVSQNLFIFKYLFGWNHISVASWRSSSLPRMEPGPPAQESGASRWTTREVSMPQELKTKQKHKNLLPRSPPYPSQAVRGTPGLLAISSRGYEFQPLKGLGR